MNQHEYDECDLPEDLIREIFVRLPGRLLLQLRTVCRSWNSLISSHEFVMHHHQRSTQPRLVYCDFASEGIDFIQCSVSSLFYNKKPTRIEPLQMKYKIMQGSCNGLLCLCEGLPYKNLMLFNPCTRWVSLIVPFEYPHGDNQQPVFCGLGYDALRNKYKFVTCSKTSITAGGLRGSRAKVCTLDANPSWKTVDHPMFPYFTCCRRGTFVSGTLNWIAYGPSKNQEDDDPSKLLEWFILTFELETESFGRLCLPRNNHTQKPSLHVLKNLLSTCFHPANDNTAACTIWIMKEYGVEKSWTILLTILFRDGIIPPNIWLEPLYISEDDILLAWGKLYQGKLLVYNFRTGEKDISSDSLSIYPLSKFSYGRFFLVYHESLVSCLP